MGTPPESTRSEAPAGPGAVDHDLEALPAPRRPWRRITLCTMSAVVVASLWLAYGLRGEASFALRGGQPRELGELSGFQGGAGWANAWAHGEATLQRGQAVRYARPLEPDSYRLARVEGNDRLWVQVRVPDDPSDPDGAHFVPPTSFVGRLIPMRDAGIRHAALEGAVAEAGLGPVRNDAWLLIDGEEPHTTRWALGLLALVLGFATFNVLGLIRLTRQVA